MNDYIPKRGGSMKYIEVPNTDMKASEISLGCMRISSLANQEISTLIHTAMNEGINFLTTPMCMEVESVRRNFRKPWR
jgi:predicted aldo/keto reductase-like oxidoreductase